MDVLKLRPRNDQVLVRMRHHQLREETVNGIIRPEAVVQRSRTEAVRATVVAAGPGRHGAVWLGHERGTDLRSDGPFIPMHPGIVPGAEVLVDRFDQGQAVHSDEREEYRMVLEENVLGVVE